MNLSKECVGRVLSSRANGETLKRIADEHGVTKECVRQICKKHGVAKPKKYDDCNSHVSAYFGNQFDIRRLRIIESNQHLSRDMFSGQSKAHSAIAKAILNGVVEKLTGKTCVDCGKPAEEYDHRDYNKPLEVEPVCKSCNRLRGYAIPLNGFFEKMMSLGHAPYLRKKRVSQFFGRHGINVCLDAFKQTLTFEDWVQIRQDLRPNDYWLIWPDLKAPETRESANAQ